MTATFDVADPVKALVRDFWNARAPAFDMGDSCVSRTPGIQRAWADVLGEILGPGPLEVLDVGAGTGELALLLHELGHRPTGVDIAPAMVETARAKVADRGLAIRFELGDAERLDFPDASFDVVHARHLVWTLPHPQAALREWTRVLRPGGRVVVFETAHEPLTRPGRVRLRSRIGWAVTRGMHATRLDRRPLLPPKPRTYPAREGLPYHGGLDPERLTAFLRDGGLDEVRIRDLVALRVQGREALPWYRHWCMEPKRVYNAGWGTKR